FFQAEDGIRDFHVTGVQTCALPISNVHGPAGSLQSVADAVKLLLKEDINLKGADRFVYMLAPFIAALCAFLIYAVIPFGPEVSKIGRASCRERGVTAVLAWTLSSTE